MAEKLNWEYDDASGEQHAIVGEYRIRACVDTSPLNPFEEWDNEWPMLAVTDGSGSKPTEYGDAGLERPLSFFTDGALILMQVHVAKTLGSDVRTLIGRYNDEQGIDTEDSPPVFSFDAAELREAFELELTNEGLKLDVLAELYGHAGIPAISTVVHGHSQGDWSALLIVATPDKQKALGVTEVAEKDLRTQAKLYSDWAFGDCYGYIIERIFVDPETDEVFVTEELDSCWGYYGSDHDESGLEEAALSCIPAEAMEMIDA